jgi:hypothetical protein
MVGIGLKGYHFQLKILGQDDTCFIVKVFKCELTEHAPVLMPKKI